MSATAQVGLGRLKEQMEVVGHLDCRVEQSAEAVDDCLTACPEPVSVLSVREDILAPHSATRHVINGIGVLDPEPSIEVSTTHPGILTDVVDLSKRTADNRLSVHEKKDKKYLVASTVVSLSRRDLFARLTK